STSRGRVGAPAAASLEHPSSTNGGGRVFSHGGIGSRRERAAALCADLNMLLLAPEKTSPGPTCLALRRSRHATCGTTALIPAFRRSVAHPPRPGAWTRADARLG